MTVFIIQNTIIYTIPLLIVALGGMFAERSGVINLALEGEMIFGAFMGAVAVYGFQMSGAMADTPQLMFIIAMIIAAASGAVFSLLLSFSAINLKATAHSICLLPQSFVQWDLRFSIKKNSLCPSLQTTSSSTTA